MNPAYRDTDVFVSLGKMKNHEELGITLSMKNLFGTTPTGLYGSRETTFHYGQKQPPAGAPQEVDPTSNRYEGYRMPRLLTDINGALPIDLAIVDGIVGACGGEGPWVAGGPAVQAGSAGGGAQLREYRRRRRRGHGIQSARRAHRAAVPRLQAGAGRTGRAAAAAVEPIVRR